MNSLYINYITSSMSISAWQVEHCVQLLEESATVPFISRYRKERTGSLNEVQVSEIKHYYNKFNELDKRKTAIIRSIEEQGKLTSDLKELILSTIDANRLEDLYLPYKPKRKTKASIAKARGLEPLAYKIFSFSLENCEAEAEKYLNEDVEDVDSALSGARDILAEWISENSNIRERLRREYLKKGKIVSSPQKNVKEVDESKYKNYFNFTGDLNNIPSHRLLAILRGFNEGELVYKIDIDQQLPVEIICKEIIPSDKRCSRSALKQVEIAIEDSYKRLLAPSIENEALKIAKEKADLESVKVFGENLSALLLAPPVGEKRVLAIDPGFRTGCKIVCLDSQGKLLHNDTIYPHPPQNEKIASIKKISNLIESYKIEVIAIGDGTASRETESFIKKIAMPPGLQVYMVSEDGASVYSASPVAREEFPNYDVTVRGAVSIGRRVMDPLAELVKIDPKSLGIGQYQHDVDQTLLREMLDNTVVSCVNSVGVNLNTASKHLLKYVSGIGPSLAQSIVDYRSENGPFRSRYELKKIKRLGDKAFEQCAGFLRITNAANPLDNSAVHPERYALVEKMAKDVNCSVSDLIREDQIRRQVNVRKYIDKEVGLPTLNDIMAELAKPGRDPRRIATVMEFAPDVQTIEDLRVGMILPGIITNITNFGAFVDIGIKQDGLIHISQMSDKFISSPNEVLKLHQHVKVRVIEVDLKRGRIQLSLKSN
ncbi:MAG TPA: Tex family protein [Bacteroidales bacterium]|nr:Tex family protein [Bacteroidales bacterium]